MTTEKTGTRAGFTAGLRMLADTLDQHPEIPLPYEGTLCDISWFLQDQRDLLVTIARAMPCTWTKEASENGKRFELAGQLAGLPVRLHANRDAVCTRMVTGVEDREVEEVVTPAVVRKVVKPVEVVRWDCLPLLAADAKAGAR